MASKDLANMQFGRLTAKEIVGKDKRGNPVELSVGVFRSGKVKSCGCLYNETRKDCPSHRKDLVEQTCLSSIVAAKTPSKLNTSGHTGVYFEQELWHLRLFCKTKGSG